MSGLLTSSTLTSERKARLVSSGCLRSALSWVRPVHLPDVFRVIEVVEAASDDPLGMAAGLEDGRGLIPWDHEIGAAISACHADAAQAARGTAVAVSRLIADRVPAPDRRNRAITRLVDAIRCTVGDPLRPMPIHPDWRTSTVLALAETIYADRAWDRLPVLADALDDAGCTHPDVIGHLRGPGPHARGCWVVDLLLGKS